jgi:hypothetical protein
LFRKPLLLPDLKSSHMPTPRAGRVNTRWRKQIQPKIKQIYFTYKTDKKNWQWQKKSYAIFGTCRTKVEQERVSVKVTAMYRPAAPGGCDSDTCPNKNRSCVMNTCPLSRLNSLRPDTEASFRIPYSSLFINYFKAIGISANCISFV